MKESLLSPKPAVADELQRKSLASASEDDEIAEQLLKLRAKAAEQRDITQETGSLCSSPNER
jgi:hypothetical protein